MDRTSPSGWPKILFLGVSFEGFVCSTLFYEQQAIARVLSDSVFYGPGYRYETSAVADIAADNFGVAGPDAIFCYIDERRLLGEPLADVIIERYGLPEHLRTFPRGLRGIAVPKIAWINDFWHCSRDEWDDILLGNGFDVAFATYCPPFCPRGVFDAFFSRRVQESVRFVPWPRSISPDMFRPAPTPKRWDVTLLGAMDPSFYHLRRQMHEAFAAQTDFVYFNRSHPGYRFVTDAEALTGASYARVINESRIFASCTGRYQIPFIKLYEVLACRTALMSDMPSGAEHLGLHDGETMLAVSASTFEQVVRCALADEPTLHRIAENGHRLFLARHTVDVRAQEFARTIASLLRGAEPEGWAALTVARGGGRVSLSDWNPPAWIAS